MSKFYFQVNDVFYKFTPSPCRFLFVRKLYLKHDLKYYFKGILVPESWIGQIEVKNIFRAEQKYIVP